MSKTEENYRIVILLDVKNEITNYKTDSGFDQQCGGGSKWKNQGMLYCTYLKGTWMICFVTIAREKSITNVLLNYFTEF